MALSGIALVTGGAGFIGSHIAEALAARGASVRVIDNLSTGHLENIEAIGAKVDFIKGDLADDATVRKVVEDVEIIFHEAALPSVPRSVANPRETHLACVDGTFNILLAAKENRVRRLIYAASSSAYGDQPTLPKVESMRPEPLSPYAAAKLVGEHYCQVFTRSYNFETICLRYFNVFGPRQDPGSPYSGVISLFITALLAGRQPTIFGDGLQSRDFCYVGNVVRANLLAAETPGISGRVFNIGSGRATTLLELLATLGGIIGVKAEPKMAPPRA